MWNLSRSIHTLHVSTPFVTLLLNLCILRVNNIRITNSKNFLLSGISMNAELMMLSSSFLYVTLSQQKKDITNNLKNEVVKITRKDQQQKKLWWRDKYSFILNQRFRVRVLLGTKSPLLGSTLSPNVGLSGANPDLSRLQCEYRTPGEKSKIGTNKSKLIVRRLIKIVVELIRYLLST